MNNPRTEEIVEALRCRAHGDDCAEECVCYRNRDFDCVSNFTVLTTAADRLEALEAQQRWIPVTERLPEDDDDVLIMSSGSISMGYFNIFRGYWVAYEGDDDNITHWMPLPELPEED